MRDSTVNLLIGSLCLLQLFTVSGFQLLVFASFIISAKSSRLQQSNSAMDFCIMAIDQALRNSGSLLLFTERLSSFSFRSSSYKKEKLFKQGKQICFITIQAMIALLFLILCTALLLQVKPYDKQYLNNLELVSLLTSSISVYFGVFFISNNFTGSDLDDQPMSDQSKLFMFTMILLSHTFFFCYWLYCFFNEFRFTFRQRYPRLYLMFFLCCREERLKLELDVDQSKEKMKPFLRKYQDLLDFLNKQMAFYEKGEIPAEDKELRDKLFIIDQLKRKIEASENFKDSSARFTKIEVLTHQRSIKSKYQSSYKILNIILILLIQPFVSYLDDIYQSTPKSILSKSSKGTLYGSQPQTPLKAGDPINSKQVSLRPSGIAHSSLMLRRNQMSKFKKDTVSIQTSQGQEIGRDHAMNMVMLSSKDWVKYDDDEGTYEVGNTPMRTQKSMRSGFNTPSGDQLEKMTTLDRINRRNMQFDQILLDRAPPTQALNDVSPAAFSQNWHELNNEISQKVKLKQINTPNVRSDPHKAIGLSFSYLTEQRKMEDQAFQSNQLANIYMIQEEDADQLEGIDHSKQFEDSAPIFSVSQSERALAFHISQDDNTSSTNGKYEEIQVSHKEQHKEMETISFPSTQQLDIQIRTGRQLLSDFSRSRKQVKKGRVIQKSRNQRIGKSTTTLEPEQVRIDEEIIDV
ncbi:hypothetical protein FGO68_gene12524 [Halteria grandinella]|uniref:Uncharacterized protein n=1 Tax=Halteria grandinella TaxID=5974 RepID=A0A8J8P8U5_HALGN|nr:hypothetical protein FGO68_gene12524 [Halteria grandinella]